MVLDRAGVCVCAVDRIWDQCSVSGAGRSLWRGGECFKDISANILPSSEIKQGAVASSDTQKQEGIQPFCHGRMRKKRISVQHHAL